MTRPLADRMRPTGFDDFFGQEHLLGERAPLRALIEKGHIPSMILWGPPGVGKTSLAVFIAHFLDRPYQILSAVNAGVKDVRLAIEKAEKNRFFDRPSPILFIDEIHRFSKSQQDALLHAVEKGVITLVGATTENPSFEVIGALLSRCQVFQLAPLEEDTLEALVYRAIHTDNQLKQRSIEVISLKLLVKYSGGDARKLLNGLELLVESLESDDQIVIDDDRTHQILKQNLSRYDKSGDMHYDIISAFIKSIRGSDPNAAIYYLGRMLLGGEDIKFIGRRLIISASEDVGLANPNALLMATQGFQAIQMIGMPEARIILAHVTIYLACSPKGNSAYKAIDEALNYIRNNPNESIPLHLRNAPTKLMKDLMYGKDYQYIHDSDDHFEQIDYFPEKTSHKDYFKPHGEAEKRYIQFMEEKWGDIYNILR